ncbi:MAG: hypothetical protein MHPSP_004710, partial [Paramarteilia canceri]
AGQTIKLLFYLFKQNDLTMLEINPMFVVKEKNELLIIDCKTIVDESALSRQKKIIELIEKQDESCSEEKNQNDSFNYVKLDGNVGCL